MPRCPPAPAATPLRCPLPALRCARGFPRPRSAALSPPRLNPSHSRKTLRNSRLVSQKDDVHVCIMCLRAIMNYQVGVGGIRGDPPGAAPGSPAPAVAAPGRDRLWVPWF